MNTYRNGQSQFELFPSAHSRNKPTERLPYQFSDLTLSVDNIIVLCIILVMIMVLSFSLGVERGKRVALKKSNVSLPAINTAVKETVVAPKNKQLTAQEELKKTIATEVVIEEPVAVETAEVIKQGTEPQNAYTIQVASFKEDKYAQKEASELEKKGFESFILSKGAYTIVCVGKFLDKKDAKSFSSKLRSRYKDYLIRSL